MPDSASAEQLPDYAGTSPSSSGQSMPDSASAEQLPDYAETNEIANGY